MGYKNHLPALLQPLHCVHYGLENEVIVEIILRLVDNQRVISSCQEDGQQSGALLPPRKIGSIFEVGRACRGNIQLDADSIFDRSDFEGQWINGLAKRFEYLARALRSKIRRAVE